MLGEGNFTLHLGDRTFTLANPGTEDLFHFAVAGLDWQLGQIVRARLSRARTDTTAPSLASATVAANGTTVTLVFDEDIAGTGTLPTAV